MPTTAASSSPFWAKRTKSKPAQRVSNDTQPPTVWRTPACFSSLLFRGIVPAVEHCGKLHYHRRQGSGQASVRSPSLVLHSLYAAFFKFCFCFGTPFPPHAHPSGAVSCHKCRVFTFVPPGRVEQNSANATITAHAAAFINHCKVYGHHTHSTLLLPPHKLHPNSATKRRSP